MTATQLGHCIGLAASNWLAEPERDSIKACLAERDELLAACEAFREWYVTEWGEAELAKDFPTLDATISEARGT